MKMRALKDYLHPYTSIIHVAGTEFDLEGDDALCQFLVDMGTLEYADEEPAPAPTKKTATQAAKPAPTKAELSSGVPNA